MFLNRKPKKLSEIRTRSQAHEYTDRLFKKDHCPIYIGKSHWVKSELSSAEYYGGCTYKKVKYILDYDTYDLVRADCLELYLKFYKPERKEIENA